MEFVLSSSVKSGSKSVKDKAQRSAQLFRQAEKLREDGACAAAEPLYRSILEKQPGHVAAMRGCAKALEAMGKSRKAERLRQKADEVESENHCAVAEKAYLSGRYEMALKCYKSALALTPELGEAVWGIADCHASLGRNKTAIKWYRRYLEIEPDEPEALHMLASLGAEKAPDRASDGYVSTYFDRFAEDFDDMLVKELEYCGPRLIVDAVDATSGTKRGDLEILDLGCGTGLCGVAFKDRAALLDGVDLSAKMLKQARKRRLYNGLIEGDIVEHLAATSARYDLVMSGDVLIYLGSLDALMSGIARVLRKGGIAVFTLEARKGSGYKLTVSGRYAHARSYVREVAKKAGLTECSVESAVIRLEYGNPVKGDVWVFRAGEP